MAATTIYTVGHSTRTWDEFVELLKAHGIKQLADVRRYPGSQRHPHFSATHFAAELPKVGVAYLPFVALGGRRQARKDSPNVGWRSESFRGYADYMMTDAFREALAELEKRARRRRTAIMCSEAVPWRCHRSLIADALLAKGWTVLDIMNETTAEEHELPAWAEVEGTEVWYPGEKGLFGAT